MDNFTQVPNKFMQDVLLKTTTKSAVKVAYAAAAKLYGFHKEFDDISNSQLVSMTGLSERTVQRAKRELQAAGLFSIDDGDGRTNLSRWQVVYKKGDKSDSLPSKKGDIGDTLSSKKGDKSSKKRVTRASPTKDNIYTKQNNTSTSNEVLVLGDSPDQEQGGTELSEDKARNKADIDACIAHLEQKLQASLDGSVRTNRRYCWLMIQKVRKDYPEADAVKSIQLLVDIGMRDDWHRQKLTGFKYLYYHAQEIANSYRQKLSKPRVVSI